MNRNHCGLRDAKLKPHALQRLNHCVFKLDNRFTFLISLSFHDISRQSVK
jgi:hypothetical protein